MVIFQFFGKLIATLTSLGLPVWQWISSHRPQIDKAIADLEAGIAAGTPITTLLPQVIADLFTASGVSLPKRATKKTCADCCKAVCDGAADAIKASHRDDMECVLKSLGEAYLAAADCC